MSLIENIAAIVVRRHGGRERFQSMRGLIGDDLSRAYDVQDAVIRTWAGDKAHAGYKIGLTTPRMQVMCGVDQPIAGTIFSGRLHHSPAAVEAAPFMRLGVESEIAVQIGKALPPAASIDLAGAFACLSQVCAAFELIDDSDADYKDLDAVSLVADNSWNGGLVLGPPAPAADLAHLKDRAGVLFRNGAELERGSSSDVMGDPLYVIVWLARHLEARGARLLPGQWITTGSIIRTQFAVAGERYRFELEGLPPVELAIA